MGKMESVQNILRDIEAQTNIEEVKATATVAVIAREMVLTSIHEAYRSALSTASPEALAVIEKFHNDIKAQIALNNLRILATIMAGREGNQELF